MAGVKIEEIVNTKKLIPDLMLSSTDGPDRPYAIFTVDDGHINTLPIYKIEVDKEEFFQKVINIDLNYIKKFKSLLCYNNQLTTLARAQADGALVHQQPADHPRPLARARAEGALLPRKHVDSN